VSEGLAQGPYVVVSVGFEPAKERILLYTKNVFCSNPELNRVSVSETSKLLHSNPECSKDFI